MSKAKIDYIGVGLMGHGAARNIIEKGYPLTIMGHRNRAPVEDLIGRGAKEGKSAAELARGSDILFLCLPSSVEVAAVYGTNGVLEGAHAGLIVVDSTTADPNSTPHRRRPQSEGRACWMRRSAAPREAEEGKLSPCGRRAETVKAVRPVMECYADTIVEIGALAWATRSAHQQFHLDWNLRGDSEAAATAAKVGVDMRKFYEVISAGGTNNKMFQMVMPWVLERRRPPEGPLRMPARTCASMPSSPSRRPAAAFIAQAVNQTLHLFNVRGHGDRFLPVLPGLLAELNGAKIRDL
jgi:3-hydroxyisobutyrate dehydrogenase-like beta-hydroxyacid dehydrogenase